MYIQAPEVFSDDIEGAVFIAGGISNCPNWQDEIADLLSGSDFTYFNPRRDGDLSKDGAEAARQIAWEFEALDRSDILLFWFPKESICPITLFEFGKALAWLESGKISTLIIGRDPEYPRAFDLDIQTSLVKVDGLTYAENFEKFKEGIRKELLTSRREFVS